MANDVSAPNGAPRTEPQRTATDAGWSRSAAVRAGRGAGRVSRNLVFACLSATSALAGQSPVEHLEVGMHYGFQLTERGAEQERWGFQVAWPFAASFEVDATLGLRPGFPGPPGLEGNEEQWFFTLDWRPLGPSGSLAIGYGLALRHTELVVPEEDARTADTTASDVAHVRLTASLGRLRPFGRLLFVNLLNRRDPIAGILLLGVSVRPF